jgi:hypothetical protein
MPKIMKAPDYHPNRFCGWMQITAKRIAGVERGSIAGPENPFMPLTQCLDATDEIGVVGVEYIQRDHVLLLFLLRKQHRLA